ncbi:sugar phosphate isomerase/epimerase family protein [Euzebya tangerina]|uniref:sugar phosphate isomerase/epimerase family protein n=1 Tax=Euzebya tangerina TaxID=591198 RepID=UPI0013C2C0B7|nr:sugar phosphate isomerase/epimerase family protein [Euzebya tangerina]
MRNGSTPPAADRPRPRLLAATGPLFMTELSYVMDCIAEAGYGAAEVMVGHNDDTRNAAQILAAAEGAGIQVPALHGPFLLLLRNVFGRSFAEKTTASMELAAEIGADVMVAHAPFRWEVRSRRWLREQTAELEESTGVTFGMENLFPVAGRSFSSVITIEEMAQFDSLVMDTSHCAVAQIDLLDMWRALSHKIVHLHVADNYGNGKDSHAPMGTGVLDLGRFLREVGESGWAGTITLELDCREYLDSREELVSFLARERLKVEAGLAGTLDVPAPRIRQVQA